MTRNQQGALMPDAKDDRALPIEELCEMVRTGVLTPAEARRRAAVPESKRVPTWERAVDPRKDGTRVRP